MIMGLGFMTLVWEGSWTIDPLCILTKELSPYHYVANNPITGTDPTGMFTMTVNGDPVTDESDQRWVLQQMGVQLNDSDDSSDEDPPKDKTGFSYVDNLSKSINSLFTINLNPFSEKSKKAEAERQENVETVILVVETVNGVMSIIVPFSSVAELMAQAQSTDGNVSAGLIGFAVLDVATMGKGGAIKSGRNVKHLSMLSKIAFKFASEAQMAEKGIEMARGNKIRVVSQLVERYGGKIDDWAKKSSRNFTKDGLQFETHWYENLSNGTKVEFKTKLVKGW